MPNGELITDHEVPPEALVGTDLVDAMEEIMAAWKEPLTRKLLPMYPKPSGYVFLCNNGLYVQAIIDTPAAARDYANRYELKLACVFRNGVWALLNGAGNE